MGDQTKAIKTKSSSKDLMTCAQVLEIKPKSVDEALIDDGWIIAMEE